jgi:nitroreductase
MLKNLVLKNRSYRRFFESESISFETLSELVDLARLSGSAANAQPLKFLLSCQPESNARIFPLLSWAGYLQTWHGPQEGERPAAYIAILGDTQIRPAFGCDHGIAAQSILLGAAERGLGGCMIGSVKKAELKQAFNLPEHLEVLLVLALGRPRETVILEDLPADGSIKYWRDEDEVHHVPKRALAEIILEADSL